jgi:hypothetical protein
MSFEEKDAYIDPGTEDILILTGSPPIKLF